MLKRILPALLFAVCLLGLTLPGLRRNSITIDELAHLPAGCTYWKFHDYHLNPEHPPLTKLLAGAGALTQQPRLETYNWRNANQWRYGDIFFEENGEQRMLFWGRLPMLLLSLLLGLAVYCCALEFYGWLAGCLALLLYLLIPELLAHGQLVTTDLGVSCFLFLTVYTFWHAWQHLTWGRALVAGCAVGLTLTAKFSGILILPILLLLSVLYAFSPLPLKVALPKYRAVLNKPVQKLAAAGGLLLAAGLVSLVIIWANYGFRYAISPDPLISADLKWDTLLTRPGLTIDGARLARTLHLVPEAYTYGFLQVLKSSEQRYSFLLGEHNTTGWWYYFPITFLIKTPLGFIGLLLLSLALLRRYGGAWQQELTLLLPPLIYFGVAMANNINIGHRHVLPIYPFLIVLVSKLARVFERPAQPVALRVVIAGLLLWQMVATALIYPHFLSYFNELAGGPKHGWQWVVDSNIDWGQDVKALGEYHQQHPEQSLYLALFSNSNLKQAGLGDVRLLPSFPLKNPLNSYTKYADIPSGAVVAVSVTLLQGMFLDQYVPDSVVFMQKLRGMQPFDRIGYSILLYRMP